MNKISLIGNLTRDPEVRYTQTGKAVATFTVAVNKPGQRQADGTWKDVPPDFVPVVVWERLAETCGNSLTKGRRVFVDGRLQIRDYETSDGQKRRVAEVVASAVELIERRPGTGGAGAGGGSGVADASSFGSDVIPDEEIPF
ncbi:MAG TPA: single-stranded DNA-binding protein [Patescibacteria group bacterium]|nr:single-stranded DNA-binding protein [Patescibacteria group bacterium]